MYKMCDARAELLFWLLNLVFLDTVVSLDLKVPIDVVDVNCQNWPFIEYTRSWMTGREWGTENSAYRIHLPVSPQLPRGARATFLDVLSLLSRSLEQAVLDFTKRLMW